MPSRNVSNLSGLVVPLVTPMKEDLTVDAFALKTLASRLMNHGVKNFFPLSELGEFFSLSSEQDAEVLQTVLKTVGSKGFVLAGCCSDTTESIVSKVKAASRQGANACVVNIPLTALTNEVFFIDFFEELFNQTDARIFLYNDPFVFKRNIPILGIGKIANWERLFGVMDFSGNYLYFRELIKFKQSLKVFQGSDSLAFDSLRLNCSGLVSPTANVLPKVFLNILHEFRSLNLQGMVREQHNITSLLEEYFPIQHRIQSYKQALSFQGVIRPYHSTALNSLSEEEKTKLEEFLKVRAK